MARVLVLGGTGVISASCVRDAVTAGHEVTVVNRGRSDRALPDGVNRLQADVRDSGSLRQALQGLTFDVAAQFLAYAPDDVTADIETFSGRVGQYVFISSASAYQTPPTRLPVTESTPLRNPYWAYSQDKIACEDALVGAYRIAGFPVTIVRPSHTYDPGMSPLHGGWTVLDRMRRGAPVVVHGDGSSLWTVTHAEDFARAFTGLLGNDRVLGEAVHITSDEVASWDQLALDLGRAAGVTPHIVHVPSDAIARLDPGWGASLLGDKAHSMTFDNSKIKALVPGWRAVVPFREGARQILDWYDADPARRTVDAKLDATLDTLVATYG